MENLNLMDTSTDYAMELNIPDFDRIYHSAPETNRPSVIKSRKKYTYDINNNRNIFTEANDKNKKNCNCQSFDNGTTIPSSHHSENWYVPGIRNNMSNHYNNKNKTFPINRTSENSFYNNAPIMAATSSNFMYNTNNNNKNNNENNKMFESHRKLDRRESIDSLPPLEDPPETVKVQVGIDDDLQMILDLDPSIVDLGSTPTITITDQTVTGLPPITGG